MLHSDGSPAKTNFGLILNRYIYFLYTIVVRKSFCFFLYCYNLYFGLIFIVFLMFIIIYYRYYYYFFIFFCFMFGIIFSFSFIPPLFFFMFGYIFFFFILPFHLTNHNFYFSLDSNQSLAILSILIFFFPHPLH